MRSTVLVVDDEVGIRDLLARWLAAEDLEVKTADSAEAALDILNGSGRIKAVLVDLDMPGKGGTWLIEQIRQQFRSTAIVLATADDSVPGTLSLRAGVVGYLVKPLARVHVLALVREGIAWSDAQPADPPAPADPVNEFLDRKLGDRKGNGGNG